MLFVDDDPSALDLYEAIFRRDDFRVLTAPSGLHALEVLSREPAIVVVVSDYWMHGMTGVALLNEVRRLYPRLGRILLTGTPDSEIVVEARHHKTLTKGMDPDLIRRVILREVSQRS